MTLNQKRGGEVVPWWGLIPAVLTGTLIGFLIAALIAANGEDDS